MKIKNYFKRVWLFTKRHKWSVLLVLTAMVIGGFFVWDSYTATTDFNMGEIVIPEKKPKLFPAPYSGLMVEEERLSDRPITVVIENHTDSRPQSGLNEADIVYETVVEGGITRFLAIYQSQEAKEIGPVRSARPYYVEWADSYDALFAHVGGSEKALNLISSLRLSDLNQFSLSNYFWRDNSRRAPHNVYTTSAKLKEAGQSKNYKLVDSNIEGYQFKEDLEKELRPLSQQFTVGFNYNYAPTYIYDPECNCYNRSLMNVIQTDRNTKEKIKAKNVVVAFSGFGSERIGRNTYTTINTTGTGTAYIYLDGKQVVGTWKRVKGKAIRFFDAVGEEVKLNPGTTWINIVPIGTTIK